MDWISSDPVEGPKALPQLGTPPQAPMETLSTKSGSLPVRQLALLHLSRISEGLISNYFSGYPCHWSSHVCFSTMVVTHRPPTGITAGQPLTSNGLR